MKYSPLCRKDGTFSRVSWGSVHQRHDELFNNFEAFIYFYLLVLNPDLRLEDLQYLYQIDKSDPCNEESRLGQFIQLVTPYKEFLNLHTKPTFFFHSRFRLSLISRLALFCSTTSSLLFLTSSIRWLCKADCTIAESCLNVL